MKKRIVAVISALAMAFGLTACGEIPGEEEKATYTITFVQAGQDDVVKEVAEGETLTDVPEPKGRTGYTVVWEEKNYTNVSESFTVSAIETANTYTITYDLGTRANDENVMITATTQTVRYDEPYNLYLPECSGYRFVKWVVAGTSEEFTNGIWKIDGNITLTAVWETDDSDEWSKYY